MGANSRLGAYSNKYGNHKTPLRWIGLDIARLTHKTDVQEASPKRMRAKCRNHGEPMEDL